MPDVFTKAKRSQVMATIRGRGNRSTEAAMVGLLREHGVSGWRRNQAVFGRPDFVFRRQKVAVFVDGCFWHGCPQHSTMPVQNRPFWRAKLERNMARDRQVTRRLRRDGWSVIRIWEHDLLKRGTVCVRRIRRALKVEQKRG